jgi:Protein of unknown function (DUF2865)
MMPLDAGKTDERPNSNVSRRRVTQFFGSSSRYWGGSYRRDYSEYRRDDYDDEDDYRSSSGGTYRTVCVRLCDGYYFPISFAVTRDRFERDAKTCHNSCGTQARLFVYRNPGAEAEDMVDLSGRPYQQLSTAFLYRREYVASCKCKPDPWEPEARDQHRLYALVAAKRKGDKQAAAELEALTAKMKQDRAARLPQAVMPIEEATPSRNSDKVRAADAPRRSDRTEDKYSRMGLGARGPREPEERPSRSEGHQDSGWISRALGRPD